MKPAACAFVLAIVLTPDAVAARLDTLDADGWYSWQVEAAEGAPAWCCVTWNRETPTPHTCNLDSDHAGYGACEKGGSLHGQVRIYAQVESGKAAKLRVLSPGCPASRGPCRRCVACRPRKPAVGPGVAGESAVLAGAIGLRSRFHGRRALAR